MNLYTITQKYVHDVAKLKNLDLDDDAIADTMTQIKLKSLLNYDELTGIFTWKKRISNSVKAGEVAGTTKKYGYISISINNKLYRAHRLAWLYVYGYLPTKDIDHINNIRNDNRILNLREATRSQNMQNLKVAYSNNKSGLLGVSWHKERKKWFSRIKFNGVTKSIGYFTTKELAHDAYLNAKREFHNFCTL